jgi:hypothetical protein
MEKNAAQKEAEYREQIRREINKTVFGDDSGGYGANTAQWPSYDPQPNEPRGPMGNIGKRFFGNNGMRA